MFSLFLHRGGVVATCEVTGTRKRSTDFSQGGLEIPCLLRIKGKQKDRLTLKMLNVHDCLLNTLLFICDLCNYTWSKNFSIKIKCK